MTLHIADKFDAGSAAELVRKCRANCYSVNHDPGEVSIMLKRKNPIGPFMTVGRVRIDETGGVLAAVEDAVRAALRWPSLDRGGW
jgi:hypothetical protein